MVPWLPSAEHPTCPQKALCERNVQSTALFRGTASLWSCTLKCFLKWTAWLIWQFNYPIILLKYYFFHTYWLINGGYFTRSSSVHCANVTHTLGMIPALQPWNAEQGQRGAGELHSLLKGQLRAFFLAPWWWSGWAASSVGPWKKILTFYNRHQTEAVFFGTRGITTWLTSQAHTKPWPFGVLVKVIYDTTNFLKRRIKIKNSIAR